MICPTASNWFGLESEAHQCSLPMQSLSLFFLLLHVLTRTIARTRCLCLSPPPQFGPSESQKALFSYLLLDGSESRQALKKLYEAEIKLDFISSSPTDSFCVGLDHCPPGGAVADILWVLRSK